MEVSAAWAWYTAGRDGRDYWKELAFTHLAATRDWRIGAFDLYRRGRGAAKAKAEAGVEAAQKAGDHDLIVDFKTHPASAEQAERIARGYRIQADVYRAAAIADPVEVWLHFTGRNAVVEMEGGVVDEAARRGSGRSSVPATLRLPAPSICAHGRREIRNVLLHHVPGEVDIDPGRF